MTFIISLILGVLKKMDEEAQFVNSFDKWECLSGEYFWPSFWLLNRKND